MDSNDLEYLGTSYGGWTIVKGILNKESVCYSLGVGNDISFDAEIIRKYGCTIYAYDPTPESIRFVEDKIRFNEISKEKFRFSGFGVLDETTTIYFYPPDNPQHISHSIIKKGSRPNHGFLGECKSLKEIMNMHDHSKIDLLKMDIEGAEYKVLEHCMKEKIKPTLLCVEFHGEPTREKEAIKNLLQNGYIIRYNTKRDFLFIHNKKIASTEKDD